MIFRPLFWPTLAALCALAILLGLGTWQVQRLAWKNDLIAKVTERAKLSAVPLPPQDQWSEMDLGTHEYRPVILTGIFDHKAEIHAFTSIPEPRGAKGGPGYWVLTPMRIEGGGTVLVNRGFVPEANKASDSRAAGLVEGLVTLTGLFRLSEMQRTFVPDADLTKNVWFARNVEQMASARAIADAAPFYIDTLGTAPGGLPQGGETRLSFRNAHLEYALTWYGLACALIAVYLAYHQSAGRLGWPKERPRERS